MTAGAPLPRGAQPRNCGPIGGSRKFGSGAGAGHSSARSHKLTLKLRVRDRATGGGSPEKPVGLVYIAVASHTGHVIVQECRFGDIGRSHVRLQTVEKAIELLRGCF